MRFLSRHRLWRYAIFPGILSTLLFGVLAFLVFSYSLEYTSELIERYRQEAGLVGYLAGGLGFIAKLITVLLALVLVLFLYRILATIIVAPFLGPLLTRLEQILVGKEKKLSLGMEIRNVFLGLFLNFRLFLLEIGLFFVSLFLGPFQWVVVFLTGSYVLGRGIFELILERHHRKIKERYRWASSHIAEIMGLGVLQYLLMLVPILGPILAPMSALAGAAIFYYKK